METNKLERQMIVEIKNNGVEKYKEGMDGKEDLDFP